MGGKKSGRSSAAQKLNEYLNDLTVWLNTNGSSAIPGTERKRLQRILSELSKRMDSVKCYKCGKVLSFSELDSHNATCKEKQEKKGNDKGARGSYDDSTDSYSEERRLDGSRDYYNNYREHGRFGSHSRYDDGGDEADP